MYSCIYEYVYICIHIYLYTMRNYSSQMHNQSISLYFIGIRTLECRNFSTYNYNAKKQPAEIHELLQFRCLAQTEL